MLLALSTVPCKDPKCPYPFHQDIPPFLSPASPGQPQLQVPGKAISLQSKQGPGAGAQGGMERIPFYFPEC